MTDRSSGRFGTRYERGVIAAAALVIVAAVITIADANRRVGRPVGLSEEIIRYYIPEPGRRAADVQLAEWAFRHWEEASAGQIRFGRTDDAAAALITLRWDGPPVRGRYGEMRPTIVNGRRGADLFVHPRLDMLGPDAVRRGAADPLFHDVLVYLTCLHEIGHALGLSHTGDRGDIMYAFRRGGDIPRFFERYRARLEQRADIPRRSAVSTADAARLRDIYD